MKEKTVWCTPSSWLGISTSIFLLVFQGIGEAFGFRVAIAGVVALIGLLILAAYLWFVFERCKVKRRDCWLACRRETVRDDQDFDREIEFRN